MNKLYEYEKTGLDYYSNAKGNDIEDRRLIFNENDPKR